MPKIAHHRRIEFVETIGKGGFGAVYLADVHGRDDFVQRVAIKVLSAEMNQSPDIAARQRDEARLLAQLNHDNIVRVMDLIEVQGRPAVVMEYVEGVDFAHIAKEGGVPPRAALSAIASTANALEAASNAISPRTGKPLRVIHRDIKPANLLLSRHGGVKVLDFGVARGDFDREGHTTSVLFGTARFMAPEQWLYQQIGHSSDIYALGISLVEILAGQQTNRAPLDPKAHQTYVNELIDHIHQPEQSPEWNEKLRQLIAAMLDFDPQIRPNAHDTRARCLSLCDTGAGESLPLFAARVIPPLLVQQRARFLETHSPEPVDLGTLPPVRAPEPTSPVPISPSDHPPTVVPRMEGTSEDPSTLAPTHGSTPIVLGVLSVATLFFILIAAIGAVGFTIFSEHTSTKNENTTALTTDASTLEPEPNTTDPTATAASNNDAEPNKEPPDGAATAKTTTPRAHRAATNTERLTITSQPSGAMVLLDGEKIGATPMVQRDTPVGLHQIELRLDDRLIKRTVTLMPDKPNKFHWTEISDDWLALRMD